MNSEEARNLQAQIDLVSKCLALVVNAGESRQYAAVRQAIRESSADASTIEGKAAANWGAKWFPKPSWEESMQG